MATCLRPAGGVRGCGRCQTDTAGERRGVVGRHSLWFETRDVPVGTHQKYRGALPQGYSGTPSKISGSDESGAFFWEWRFLTFKNGGASVFLSVSIKNEKVMFPHDIFQSDDSSKVVRTGSWTGPRQTGLQGWSRGTDYNL